MSILEPPSLTTTRPPLGGPHAAASRSMARRRAPHYVELKANVHRKLLNRLNLEALASADRARAESEIRTLVGELLAEENAPLSLSEREVLFSELVDEVFGLGSTGTAAARSVDQRHHRQHL